MTTEEAHAAGVQYERERVLAILIAMKEHFDILNEENPKPKLYRVVNDMLWMLTGFVTSGLDARATDG